MFFCLSTLFLKFFQKIFLLIFQIKLALKNHIVFMFNSLVKPRELGISLPPFFTKVNTFFKIILWYFFPSLQNPLLLNIFVTNFTQKNFIFIIKLSVEDKKRDYFRNPHNINKLFIFLNLCSNKPNQTITIILNRYSILIIFIFFQILFSKFCLFFIIRISFYIENNF